MNIDFRSEIQRRGFLKQLALGAGGAMLSPLAQSQAQADPPPRAPRGPKRFVFFLQNQGLYPVHCRPNNIRIDDGYSNRLPGMRFNASDDIRRIDRVLDVPLAARELPDALAPLAPYVNRMTIVQTLNGKHVHTQHGAGYGALGAAQFGSGTIPFVETIDCALSRVLPAPFPLLAFGWQRLSAMQSSPICYCSSAWGRQRPAPGYSNPLMAHSELFGAGGSGEVVERFQHGTETLDLVNHDVQRMQTQLSSIEQARFEPLVAGFDAMRTRRRQLAAMADRLRQHAPRITERYTAPQLETDWKQAGFEVASAALIAGLTNVVTIASGMCNVDRGPFEGLGMTRYGHGFGHTWAGNADWIRLHRYNMQMLATLVERLQAVREGNGTMLDNTLIVYTSCHAEKQHSRGDRWPFILIGNLGGQLRTGRYIHFPLRPRTHGRSVNALYATLLRVAGAPCDRFNLDRSIRDVDRAGPLEELLA